MRKLFSSRFRPVKKLIKTRFNFNVTHRSKPIVLLHCRRLVKYKHFPRWTLHTDDIHEGYFEFHHEPYSKKHFIFEYTVMGDRNFTAYKDKHAMIIVGELPDGF